jgi:GNAT superfamily N-acetyltransferase
MQFKAQSTHYAAHWPASEHSVIQIHHDGALHDVGRLWLDRRPGLVHVLDITLLPAWCGRGLGSACLMGLRTRGQALSIQVEDGNPARRLYERLGFVPVGEPQGIQQLMRWAAKPQSNPGAQASSKNEALNEQT